MEKFQALMRKKVAGIPVLYIALAVAAVMLYAAIRYRPVTEETEPTDAQAIDTGGDDVSGDYAGTVQQPVFSSAPVASVTAVVVEDTNEAWGRRAVEWLVSSGATLSLATSAITKYLNADTLSQAEGILRDKAVKQFGIPPEGLIATSTAGYAGPATRQGTPPCKHTVKGKSDNSFAELSLLYFGLNNADAINQMHSANPSLVEPLRVGQVVQIPAFHTPRYYTATSATRTLYAIASKNGTTPAKVQALNPRMVFPVKVGTRVRVR